MKNTLLLCAGIIIFIGSCKKPDTTPTVVSTYPTYSSMDTIYQMLEVKPKYVTVNGATGGTFYGTSGTRYVIPPNCLQDASGNPVTTNVQFEVAEYLKKGDMIFSGVLPISDNDALISGGEIYINATLSGMPIYLKAVGCTFSATIPKDKDSTPAMQFYVGRPGPDPIKNRVNWKQPDTPASIPSYGIVYNGDTIPIISDSFQFCNADRLPLSGWTYQKFTITITASSISIPDSALHTFALYDNFKSLWRCEHYGKPVNNIYKQDHLPNLPMHFVSYALINNRFYAGVTPATPKTGENYTVTLTEADPAAFKAQLNNLTK